MFVYIHFSLVNPKIAHNDHYNMTIAGKIVKNMKISF